MSYRESFKKQGETVCIFLKTVRFCVSSPLLGVKLRCSKMYKIPNTTDTACSGFEKRRGKTFVYADTDRYWLSYSLSIFKAIFKEEATTGPI